MKMPCRLASIFALSLFAIGCAAGPSPSVTSYNGYTPTPSGLSASFGGKTYEATDRLLAASRTKIGAGSALIVASLVSVDNLEQSSTFGRMVAEQASGRLAQLGYRINEPKLRGSLAIRRKTGELKLSRDLAQIGKSQQAQAAVTGTYAVGGQNIYVNLRLISLSTGQILSAVDYLVPIDRDTRRMTMPEGSAI